ncbi:MAG: hypothetical protein IJO18_04920 [Alphaproteobacteria bacterium]|nr:hypothetical protein [Alphaproteobacteria bacterium]
MIGGILRPVARLVCLCGPGVMLFDSGGDDNFVTYNSVSGALKIDLFFVCGAPCGFVVEKIKIIY